MYSHQELISYIKTINPVSYAKTRNFLDGEVTKLSPYITRGVVSLPHVRDLVLESYTPAEAKKFIQELAWREYFQKVWIDRGDDIFRDIRFEQEEVVSTGIPTAIIQAQTGAAALDAGVETLYETGYMHNHMRMSIASVICNLARYRWLEPAQWMYYHLLDGDPASNMLSWQWIAGTSVSKRYTTSQSLINYWSGSNQKDTFLDFDRDNFFDQPVPEVLKHLTKFDKATTLPGSDLIDCSQHQSIFVYHPWHLAPSWRTEEEGLRILLLKPSVFEKFPVSPRVLDFIITSAQKYIPQIQIFVGEEQELIDLFPHEFIRTVEHPTITTVPTDEREWLFPQVNGYYKSFFAFWKECEKYL